MRISNDKTVRRMYGTLAVKDPRGINSHAPVAQFYMHMYSLVAPGTDGTGPQQTSRLCKVRIFHILDKERPIPERPQPTVQPKSNMNAVTARLHVLFNNLSIIPTEYVRARPSLLACTCRKICSNRH
eukprot:COSAG05_NODE_331_length_11273_cov_3.896635_1_plen_127_part_00